MLATLPTQDDVNKIAEQLRPDVVRIRIDVGKDWSDDPALYFRVTLSDEAARKKGHLAELSGRVAGELFEQLGLSGLEHIPYFNFRSESDQKKLQDPAWS